MSVVYAAVHDSLRTRHAVKVFDVSGCTNAETLRGKFLAEARVLATLRHPNIVRVTDFGTTTDGKPWLAMDLVEGDTLAAKLSSSRPPTPNEAVSIYCDLRDALAYCHSLGIVHGDLKAENVLLRSDGHAVLSDFGIARIVNPQMRERLELTGSCEAGGFGTAYAIAPECRDGTPATSWMNGICSYSLWWIIIHHHLYWYYGDKEYLSAQKTYLTELLRNVMKNIDGNKEAYKSGRFIDWPTNDNPDAIHAGLQALTVRALEAGSELAGWLSDPALAKECRDAATKLRTYVPDNKGNKEAAALLAIEGMLDAKTAHDIIVKDGAKDFTSFMGYYMLEALAKNGSYADALDLISEYWGRMLDLGATTFWEDFNYMDSKNAARIDEFVPEGKFDIHADGGAYCYVGLRHSFCHGWASGPTAWLSQHILGVEPASPGFKTVRIRPHLGNLKWVEGDFPTPYGIIHVTHSRRPDGQISSTVELPEGVELSAE